MVLLHYARCIYAKSNPKPPVTSSDAILERGDCSTPTTPFPTLPTHFPPQSALDTPPHICPPPSFLSAIRYPLSAIRYPLPTARSFFSPAVNSPHQRSSIPVHGRDRRQRARHRETRSSGSGTGRLRRSRTRLSAAHPAFPALVADGSRRGRDADPGVFPQGLECASAVPRRFEPGHVAHPHRR